MVKFFQLLGLHILGFLAAYLPTCFVAALCKGIGQLAFWVLPRLKNITLANLDHAFPERSLRWKRHIAKVAFMRTVELGLMGIASPYFSKHRIRRSFFVDPSYVKNFKANRGSILLIPHFSGIEAIPLASSLVAENLPEIGVIYRPFNNAALEAYIQRTRQRGSLQLLSRKGGFHKAIAILKRKGSVGILFDQNAGKQGTLVPFFGRLASTTPLPGLLAERFDCQVCFIYTERLGFWKSRLHMEVLECTSEAGEITRKANEWLEHKLTHDENLCSDWLWLHNRWKIHPSLKENLLLGEVSPTIAPFIPLKKAPDMLGSPRIVIRIPNWLGDVVMALPILRAFRKERPNAHITLLCPAHFLGFLKNIKLADDVEAIPAKKFASFSKLLGMRKAYVDELYFLTRSRRNDWEHFLIKPACSYAMGLTKRSYLCVKDTFEAPQDAELHQTHRMDLWLKHLQFEGALDFTPIANPGVAPRLKIALITGSTNMPHKRWSVHHWRDLLRHLLYRYPQHKVVLLGSAKDVTITRDVIHGFDLSRVENLAGQTDLVKLMQHLRTCQLVIGNDTGALHLANALGVPSVGLYGPTDPRHSRPIFDAPCKIVEPEEGSRLMDSIAVKRVLEACESLLPATRSS